MSVFYAWLGEPNSAKALARHDDALLGGTLCYTGVSVGLGCGWLMADGHKQDELLRWFAGLGVNIAALASAAKYNTSVGWATGSAVYGKHIRDVGGILLVMAQAALGKYVVGYVVGISVAALLWTAVAAGIVDRQHLKKLREAAEGFLEEAESGGGNRAPRSPSANSRSPTSRRPSANSTRTATASSIGKSCAP